MFNKKHVGKFIKIYVGEKEKNSLFTINEQHGTPTSSTCCNQKRLVLSNKVFLLTM